MDSEAKASNPKWIKWSKNKTGTNAKHTAQAIKKQVTEEVGERLPDQVSALVVDSALKKNSNTREKERDEQRRSHLNN